MSEFEDLVKRTHEAGMKVIIDFTQPCSTGQYFSDAREPFVEDLGQTDNVSKAFDVNNNFYYLPGDRRRFVLIRSVRRILPIVSSRRR